MESREAELRAAVVQLRDRCAEHEETIKDLRATILALRQDLENVNEQLDRTMRRQQALGNQEV